MFWEVREVRVWELGGEGGVVGGLGFSFQHQGDGKKEKKSTKNRCRNDRFSGWRRRGEGRGRGRRVEGVHIQKSLLPPQLYS